jgi:hypothetical protein
MTDNKYLNNILAEGDFDIIDLLDLLVNAERLIAVEMTFHPIRC